MGRKRKHPLKGREKEYEVWGLRKQADKARKRGDLSFYFEEEVQKLEQEVKQEQEEIKKKEEEKIKEIIRFEEELERENREFFSNPSTDINTKGYFIKKDPSVENKSFVVSFKDHPKYFYLAFTKTRDKARAMGQRFIRDTFYPTFGINDCPVSLRETTARRLKELDEYAPKGQAPIPSILKAGISFSCSICGKDHFNYHDYEIKRCFIIEGDGDCVPYAKGMIVCYDCYKKYFK